MSTPAIHSKTPQTPHPPLLVVCLCADWCGTCKEYQPLFKQLGAKFPDVPFLWIDIEDDADLIEPLEVENFPTLLIAGPGQPLFFGTITPHLETLQRLVQAHLAPDARLLQQSAELNAVVQRLWQRVV